jgi:hypothetical protein
MQAIVMDVVGCVRQQFEVLNRIIEGVVVFVVYVL